MSQMRAALGAAVLLLSSACFYEGRYLVRGTVLGQGASGAEPVAGAYVVVTPQNGNNASQPATVSPDGSFEGEFRHGGMGFLLYVPGDGDPRVDFGAPRYRSCSVSLRGDMVPPCVSRRPCNPPRRGCYVFEAVLMPETP
jgi:hypothetical protein